MAPSIPNDIYQYSLHSAYTAGLKDGGPPVAFLTNHGTHGVGYFELETDSDDEDSKQPQEQQRPNDMIQLDGVAYSIDGEGNVEKADKEDSLPHVMVTVFQPAQRAKLPTGANAKKVKDLFAGNKNTPLPFRIQGAFKYLSTQQETYWNVRGTVFGFCVPNWQKSVSGEGLQCCFLSEDKRRGGRVAEFEVGEGTGVEWARCGRFHLGFPQDEEYEELRL